METELQAVLANTPCAELGASLSEDRVARLVGTVPSEARRVDLSARAAAVPGVAEVDPSMIVTRPAPHCEAAERVEQLVGEGGLPLPVITLSRPDGVYVAGRDVLEVALELPGGPAAYLYLDYFDEYGQVYHLTPEPLAPENVLTPGAVLRVGKPRAGATARDRVWEISEPFGAGYLVAIASGSSLYEGLRPLSERAADYLDFLARALPAGRSAGLSTTAVPLETRSTP